MQPRVITETDEYILANKPAGLVVHSDGKTNEPTLVEWVLEHYPEISGVGEQWETPEGELIDRSGIVHRLDRDTSGIMVIARTQEAFEKLKDLFKNHEIQKEYRAIVWDWNKGDRGVINEPIGRSKSNFRAWISGKGASRGQLRDAQTEFEVLGRFETDEGRFMHMSFRPKTGRTHQIRVHSKYFHHPIVSDELYSGKRGLAFGFTRQALHAYSIEFPWNGKVITATAELPEDFRNALHLLE